MSTKPKKIVYSCVVIPAAVTSGIVSGISGVIASYFFRPIWNKITKIWEKPEINNDSKIN